ncbi:MAG TPA: kelch repeat-containing protein [Acidimicrobiales bacterium]|nr:kelch repeat-containing protein [Acidimicrobiales bacterium]
MSVNSPLARRMPGFDARHATRRARRTRVAAALVVVLALAASLFLFLGHRATPHPRSSRPPLVHRATPPRVVSTLAPWRLGAPISRTVVMAGAGPGNQLVILGGATTGGLTASGAFSLDVATGTLTHVGDLMATDADAAGAVIGGRDVVFGGTSASPSTTASGPASATASVQVLAAAPTTGQGPTATAVPVATSLGTLPQARAAAVAVTAGTTTYLVGGHSAVGPDPSIVATVDGQHFVAVASLSLPVDFPAVAVDGDTLFVFGGVALTGSDAGRPVSTIEVVDLKTHRVTDAARLPEPLTGAAAVVLGRRVLLAGGDTAAPTGPDTGSAAASAPATPTTSSVSTVWSFDAVSDTCTQVGVLPVAVAHAGVAVLGSTAWLVGGETDGTPVSSVQSLVTAP